MSISPIWGEDSLRHFSPWNSCWQYLAKFNTFFNVGSSCGSRRAGGPKKSSQGIVNWWLKTILQIIIPCKIVIELKKIFTDSCCLLTIGLLYYWSNTNQTIIYWLLHFLTFFSCSAFTWGKKYIHYRRPNAVYNVITRWKSVISRKMTPIIICHQNDNHHDHHWDETLRTIPVASESIRFYISTYSGRFTLIYSIIDIGALTFILGTNTSPLVLFFSTCIGCKPWATLSELSMDTSIKFPRYMKFSVSFIVLLTCRIEDII